MQCCAVRAVVWSDVNLQVIKFSEVEFCGGFPKVSQEPYKGERNGQMLPQLFSLFFK